MNNDRFKGLIWADAVKSKHCLIIGLGGIGSWLSLSLSRTGTNIYVMDNDCIEEHNIGGQFYGLSYVNMPKTDATKSNIEIYSGQIITTFQERYTKESDIISNYCFSAFDNMEGRKNLFENWVKHCETLNNKEDALFVDGRLNAEKYWIYTVRYNQEDIEKYRKELFDDSEIEDLPCTEKATTYSALGIASQMTSSFINHISNLEAGFELRNINFKVVKDYV